MFHSKKDKQYEEAELKAELIRLQKDIDKYKKLLRGDNHESNE